MRELRLKRRELRQMVLRLRERQLHEAAAGADDEGFHEVLFAAGSPLDKDFDDCGQFDR